MPLFGRAYTQYLTASVPSMRSDDFAGQNVVHAVKGNAFTGNYSQILDRGKWVTINKDNYQSVCVDVFARWASDLILAMPLLESVSLVAVPNKSAMVSNSLDDFATAALARAVKNIFSDGVFCAPTIRWARSLQKASDGGTRDPDILFQALTMVSALAPKTSSVLLIDDVTTTGGHSQACAAILRAAGYKVEGLLCVAKTYHIQQAEPFNLPDFELEDFQPL